MQQISENPLIVGCSCGNPKIEKEWDKELGAYYYFISCEKCGYYWEGPIYL